MCNNKDFERLSICYKSESYPKDESIKVKTK